MGQAKNRGLMVLEKYECQADRFVNQAALENVGQFEGEAG